MDIKSFILSQDSKAIPAHPALLDAARQADPLIVNGPTRTRTPFGQREAARHLNAYGGSTDAIDWVMDCVRLITDTAGSAAWHLERDGEKYVTHKGKDSPADAKEAPMMLTKLIEEPNPYMSYEELLELALIDYLLVGNAYWMKWRTNDAGQPLALYRLAPPFVKLLPGSLGVAGYEYNVPGFDPIKFTPDQIVHFRMPNPHSAYLGLGVIQGGSRMLDLELALTDTQASYYEKKAQPSMVVQSDRRVPKDVFMRLRSQLRAMYGGPKNAGALMVLESGLKYQSISPSATDAAFEPLTKLSRDRILAMFRVPGTLLGVNDSAQAATKVTDDQRVFDQKTMRPLLNKMQNVITRGIVQNWDGFEFKIDYDYIMPIEDRIRLTSAFAAIPGVRVREVREYAGLDRLGDERDDIVLNLPGEDATAADTHAGIPDNNLTGEAGRPPNPSNTAAFPAPGEALPKGANASRRTSLAAADNKKAIDVSEASTKLAERLVELEAKAMEPAKQTFEQRIKTPDDTLQIDRDAIVDAVAADIEAGIRKAITTLERGLLDETHRTLEGKAIGDRLRSKLRKSAAWETFASSLSAVLEKAARKALSASVMQQGRLGNMPEDEIDYEALAKEIVYRSGGLRKIKSNFQKEVGQKVGVALKEGQTRADVEQAIREAMDFWRVTHAETVALTEAVHAYNEGTLTVAELTGHTHVFVHDGDDHDEPCIEANGQVWEIDHAREHRLEHPRCRRAFTPVTVDDVE